MKRDSLGGVFLCKIRYVARSQYSKYAGHVKRELLEIVSWLTTISY